MFSSKVLVVTGLLAAVGIAASVFVIDTPSPESRSASDAEPISIATDQASSHVVPMAKVPALPQKTAGAPDLRLHGTIAIGQPDSSVALIAKDQDSQAGTYRIGDRLPGGAILENIMEDQVQVRTVNNDSFVLTIDKSNRTDTSLNRQVSVDVDRVVESAVGARDGQGGQQREKVQPRPRGAKKTATGETISVERQTQLESVALDD